MALQHICKYFVERAHYVVKVREGGREEGREGGREGEREGGREGGRYGCHFDGLGELDTMGGREGGREREEANFFTSFL